MTTVIVGGGIAGLTVAIGLARAGVNVIVLERYPAYGGRIVTHRSNKSAELPALQYEIGAGRIHKDHRRVAALVKHYGLTQYPISTESTYQGQPNRFLDMMDTLRGLYETQPRRALGTTTIGELVPDDLHALFIQYPYWAEIFMMRADLAFDLFKPSGPMGSRDSGGPDFYGLQEGLDALIYGRVKDAHEAGVDLRNRHRVHDVQRLDDDLFEITGDYGKKADAKPFTIQAQRVIIATCRCSLGGFSVLKGTPMLKQTGTSPLTRIYAVYPKPVWFKGLGKMVTDSRLRYVIPIDESKGLIMISYTDGNDTKYWSGMDDAKLKKAIAESVRRTFPDKDVPEPLYLQKHEWPSGCTYWLPGDYDVADAIQMAMNPGPNLYVVGESISQQQTWVEGALESAEQLLRKLTK